MSMNLDYNERQKHLDLRLSRIAHGCFDWLASGPAPQPPDIQNQLLHHSLTKTRTLVIAIIAFCLTAAVAAAMTAAVWAFAWLLAECVIGAIRLCLMTALVRAEKSGKKGNTVAPIIAGMTSFIVISSACYQCVVSGEWPLIAMSGIALASLIGAVSSRNAGTPRLGAILICILALPYAAATLISPLPHLFIIGIQFPFYACGVIFVMRENYEVLLNLYHSERANRQLAQQDLLTGLPNRAENLKRFDQLLKGLRSGHGNIREELMVFCLDLDGFKDVNDRYGHAAGDAVLVAVAQRLRGSVRSLDFVSRVGGDEFVILLPAISSKAAADIAERIIVSVSAPYDVGLPAPAHIGISIGGACAPDDGESADELLRSADRALYEAKRRGKGNFVAHGTLPNLELAADADARMAGIERRERDRTRAIG
jgi:diguanylate cyclase